MYRVLLVEDEYNVCQLLLRLVDWGALGFDIIGTAADGSSALQFVIENRPEVVITDIRIPDFDGVELLRRAKEYIPDANFVIVSGYRHFEYAVEAIKLGVEDYLLKPIEELELASILKKIRTQREQRTLDLAEKERLENESTLYHETAQKELFFSLINAPALFEEMTLEDLSGRYCLDLHGEAFQTFAVRCDPRPSVASENPLLIKKLSLATKRFFSDCGLPAAYAEMQWGLVGLVGHPTSEPMRQHFCHYLECLMNLADGFGSYNVWVSFSDAVQTLSVLPASYRQTLRALMGRMFAERPSDTGRLLPYYVDAPDTVSVEQILALCNLNDLLVAFRRGAGADIAAWFQSFSNLISEQSGVRYASFCAACTHIMKELFEIRNQIQLEERDDDDWKELFLQCGTVADFCGELGKCVAALSGRYLAQCGPQNLKIITLARNFMEQNFSRPIKVEDVAKQINFSPSHFASVFRQEVGVTFLDYLTSLRIEAAKNLLRYTQRTLPDIAAEVGYQDARYFSKLFKNSVGLKPSEYRKLYQ